MALPDNALELLDVMYGSATDLQTRLRLLEAINALEVELGFFCCGPHSVPTMTLEEVEKEFFS